MKKKNIGKAVLFAPAVALAVLGLKDSSNINDIYNGAKTILESTSNKFSLIGSSSFWS